MNWWGTGPPPHERWAGVTIPIDDCGGKYRFDAEQANRVCKWFPSYCSHSKGEFVGKRFALLDYQMQLILRPLFGWVRAEDGLRRFQKAFIEIPKKNGKTQLIAGLALYMLLADGEPGAEVYVAASDTDQARILFGAAKSMVQSHPSLQKRLIIYRNEIRRRDDETAFFKVLSSEAKGKHGFNIHCLVVDELHAQPDRELFETLTRGVIARRQPLTLLITTAGDDDESICYEEYDYAKRVLSGTIPDERHLPVIFEAAPDDDMQDPTLWHRINPGLGVTISEDALASFAVAAAHEPRKRNDFLRFHLNRWVNQAESWIPTDWWDACDAPVPSDAELALLPCAGGLDMAQKIDLASFVVTFRVRSEAPVTVEAVDEHEQVKSLNLNYRIIVVPFFWIPEDTMVEREKRDGIPYRVWVEQGLVFVTEGSMIDYDAIVRDITTKILVRFPTLRQGNIGYDPAFADDVSRGLNKFAARDDWCQEVLQNYKYFSEPCYTFEALIKSKGVVHGGHRVLRNHVENVAVKRDDAGRLRPVRPKSSSKKIDGVVATLMGLRTLASVPDDDMAFSMFFLGGQADGATPGR